MPFPFVATGLADPVPVGIIAAALSVHNDNKRAEAAEGAEREAPREKERLHLEKKQRFDAKLEKLKEEYGEEIPEEQAKEFSGKQAELLGAFQGNCAGLKKKGKSASAAAEAAMEELQAVFEAAGMK